MLCGGGIIASLISTHDEVFIVVCLSFLVVMVFQGGGHWICYCYNHRGNTLELISRGGVRAESGCIQI